MFPFKIIAILPSILGFFLPDPRLSAADTLAAKILTRDIQVVNQDGKPVAGATVDGASINGQYFWPTNTLDRKMSKTDAQGVAALRYPENADFLVVKVPVESVSVNVMHPDYCSEQVEVPVGDQHKTPFQVKLSPGISLSLSAVDELGKPVSEPFAVAMTGAYYLSRWNRPSPAKAQARFLKSGNQQLMLFQPKADGRHLFSDILSFHFDSAKEPEVVLEEIELQPGKKLQGRLADSVPRPIKNGYALAAHLPLPLGSTHSAEIPSLIYYAAADIQADGTFEFPSMPPTGTVQLIGLCDHWVGLKAKESTFIVGQTFDVEDEKLSIVLDMERTFDAKIRVVDQAGEPVEGVALVSTPNQAYEKGGSTILGLRRESADILKCQIRDEYDPAIFLLNLKRFHAVSDRQGQMVIRNLPNNRSSTSFECWSTDAASVEVKLDQHLDGKLPGNNEYEVAFDVKVEVVRLKTEAQSTK